MNIYTDPEFDPLYSGHPLTLIDVGASGGISKRWQRAEKHLRVIGFEPDARAFQELNAKNDGRNTFINTALSDEDKDITFNLSRKQHVSSVFSYNSSFVEQFPEKQRFEKIGSEKIAARRLSRELLNEAGIKDADFLKVDTEGGELAVLQGAEEMLIGHIFGIDVEVCFADLRVGQPHFDDVDRFLRSKGFQLFDIKRHFWKRAVGADLRAVKGQLIIADALYIKSYETFFKELSALDRETVKCKMLKALSICLVYGLLDYALYICTKAAEDKLLSQHERQLIENNIRKKDLNRTLKGQSLLARILYTLYLYVKPKSFYSSDEELGNEYLRW